MFFVPGSEVFRGEAGGVEVGCRHAPRLADSRGAARHRRGLKVADALEPGQVREQELAAPDRAVGAVTRAVEGDAEDRAILAVVRQARSDVRVVMLDADVLDAFELERVLRGQVLGMQIVRDDGRGDVEQLPPMPDALGVGLERLVVLEVADVMRDERVVVFRQAEGVFQLGAAAQHVPWEFSVERDGFGRVPARPSLQLHAPADGPDHGVVGAGVDGAVVDEEGVGDVLEAAERVLVAVDDGLVGDVRAGQHDRAAEVAEQEVMQRRVGQQEADPPVPRCDRRREGTIRDARQ